MDAKILFAIPFVVILVLSGCKLAADAGNEQAPVLGASCGTVSPDSRNECCERQMKDAIHVMCVGAWKWLSDTQECSYLCTTSERISSFEACAAAGNPVMESHPRQCVFESQTYVETIQDSEPAQDQLIGGQRDEHGCLGPAGYSWNEEIGACSRQWELDESQVQAAKIAVAKIGQANGLTVVEVLTLKCPGCFDVKFDTNQEQTVVQIRDGQAE